MRKLIAAMNMTLDGFCDHTSMNADDELHRHYNELLGNAGDLVYGRTTYQLMENYWPSVVKNPVDNKEMNEFALLIDNLSKVVFSHTLRGVQWKNSRLAKGSVQEEMQALKQSGNGNSGYILVGSPSLIAATLQLGLVDEFQICVQPIIVTKGLSLFTNITGRIDMALLKTKTLSGTGSVVHYYKPGNSGER